MLSRSRKAFTLIELIVVIVILGLLAALAIPTFSEVINKAKENTAVSSAESIGRNAVALAAFRGDGKTPTDADLKQAIGEAKGASATSDVLGATDFVATVNVSGKSVELTFAGNTVAGKVVADVASAPVTPPAGE